MKVLHSLLVASLVVALAAPAMAQGVYSPRGDGGYQRGAGDGGSQRGTGGGGYRAGGFRGGGLIGGLLFGAAAAAAAAAAQARDRDRTRPEGYEPARPPRRFHRRYPPADMMEADGPPPPHRIRPHRPITAVSEPPPRHRAPKPKGVETLAASRPKLLLPTRALLPALDEKRLAPDEILVAFKTEKDARQGQDFARAQRLDYVQVRPLKLIGVTVHRLKLPQGANLRSALRQAGRDASVAWAQPNYYYQLQQSSEPAPAAPAALAPVAASEPASGQGLTSTGQPTSPPAPTPASEGYVAAALNLAEAHKLARGQGVAVAVIDSQVDAAHPELAGVATENFDSLGAGSEAHAHGTAMAGAISGHLKLAGAAPAARLLAVRAFDPSGGTARGATLNIVAGLDWAAEKGARIVNMSFAGPADPLMEKMVGAASARGVALIAAAGNEGPNAPPQYPGAYAPVIAVAAVDEKARIYSKANRGDYITLAAPGVDVLAAAPHGGYDLSTGTSIACAEVSGIAALILEKNPGLDLQALRKILRDSARKISGEGDLGEADAAAALQDRSLGRP